MNSSRVRVPSLTLAIGATLACSTPGQQPDGFDHAWKGIAAEFKTQCKAAGIVGASLGFMHRGKTLGLTTWGFADLATKRPVDADTIYHWASITKTFTGIAVMQLRDRGRLQLDQAILDYVPELRQVHNPFGPMRAITLRHLLSHSAGFRGPTWPWGGDKPWHPHEPTRFSQLLAMLPYTEIEFRPGSRYSYSNPGIVFLGRVIEELSGDDYEVYMDKNVLKPLGMHRSYFDLTPYHLQPDRSNSYRIGPDGPTANGIDFDTGVTVSNGGLNAPIPDMARYLTFLTGTAEADSDQARVLSRSSLEQMWQPVVPTSGKDSVGLAFFIMQRGKRRYIGHTGGQRDFVSFFYVHPETQTAGIAAFNSSTGGQVMAAMRRRMTDRLTPLFTGSAHSGR